jgi:sulfide dehydrogenase cytochrome subunit
MARILIGTAIMLVSAGCAVAQPATIPLAAPPPGASSCSGCHPARSGVETSVPRLQGRKATEVVEMMQAFRSGQRPSTVMDRIAKGFSDTETQAIAAWYESQR